MRYCSKIICFLCFALLANSCHKDPPINQTANLNGNMISAFGHAGMGLAFKYPIDSYESIEPCLRIGADGSEMDIQMTKDSVLVVYHNKVLEEETLCEGTINDKLWPEIWGCHRTSAISSRINLKSFNDLMNELISAGYNIHDYTYTFDCKLYSHASNPNLFLKQYANAVLKAIDDFQLTDNLLIESQDTTFLRILQKKRSGLKLFIYPSDFNNAMDIALSMKLYGITIHTDLIDAKQVKFAHDNGIRVTLWGINTENKNVEAVLKSPDFIQTDKPIHLLKIFGKYKGNINDLP
jgi:glycerophosphoryl diester phosphodiesterase